MDAKEFLSRPEELAQELDDAKQKVAALKARAERHGIAFGPEAIHVTHSRNTTAMEETIISLAEAREEEVRLREAFMNAALEIGLVIDRVPEMVLRQFLEKRYLEFMTVIGTAEAMGHSERWGRQKHREALEAVQEILDSESGSGFA